MNLRSLRITTYLAPMALMVACGSNASTEAPLSPSDGQDASTSTSNSSGGSSSGNGSSGNGSNSGDDAATSPTPTPSGCAQDSDCTGECDGSVVCCCDLSSVTCYSPASGQCGGGDDAGGSAGNAGGGFPI